MLHGNFPSVENLLNYGFIKNQNFSKFNDCLLFNIANISKL